MSNPWKKRIIAYNRTLAQRTEKASDMDVIVSKLIKLLPGQLKKLLTDDVLTVLSKYGYEA